jgi:acyl CoA:acetate/3-ketoacid CoA transferase
VSHDKFITADQAAALLADGATVGLVGGGSMMVARAGFAAIVALTEIAPGVDLQRDILDRTEFPPPMPQAPATMATDHFEAKDCRAA